MATHIYIYIHTHQQEQPLFPLHCCLGRPLRQIWPIHSHPYLKTSGLKVSNCRGGSPYPRLKALINAKMRGEKRLHRAESATWDERPRRNEWGWALPLGNRGICICGGYPKTLWLSFGEERTLRFDNSADYGHSMDAASLLTVGSFLLTVELFLLTIDNFTFFTYNFSFSSYNFSFLTYSWSFFADGGKVRLIRALRHYKQRSLTVSKKAPTVSKKASPFLCWSYRAF